jgi:predicted dehydrogenase
MTVSYRIAVAGCGGMANAWVEYALGRDDTEIVALVDLHLSSAQAMADRYNITCGTFTDLKQAIAETEANLVFDVTIPESHFTIASTALEMGCQVFGEKPLAGTME